MPSLPNLPPLASLKEIVKAKTIIVEGACFLIRDRADVNVWEDPWVPGYNDLFLPQDLCP